MDLPDAIRDQATENVGGRISCKPSTLSVIRNFSLAFIEAENHCKRLERVALHLHDREKKKTRVQDFVCLPQRLFLACVEHACDQGKSGGNSRFTYTKKEACRHESSKAVDCTMAHENSAP